MAFRRTSAKSLVTPQKRKRNKKIANWFAQEFKEDFKQIQEKESFLFKLIRNYYQEVYYRHDTNLHSLYKAIIKYYISCLAGSPKTNLAEKINACPYVYTGLAWFEAVAFI